MAAKKKPKSQDIVLLHSRTEDGEGLRAIRARKEGVELAELRPVQEGKPLNSSEIIKLKPRKAFPLLCDVEVQYKAEAGSGHAGPARVTSDTYRRNWGSIFSRAKRKAAAEGAEEGEETEDKLLN